MKGETERKYFCHMKQRTRGDATQNEATRRRFEKTFYGLLFNYLRDGYDSVLHCHLSGRIPVAN